MAMMAMTTSSSISVNADRLERIMSASTGPNGPDPGRGRGRHLDESSKTKS
jgi:hypothetical protein